MTAPKTDSADKFIREVMAGKHDLRISDVIEAMTLRVQAGEVSMRWEFNSEWLNIREDDLTLDEYYRIEEVGNKPWGQSRPIVFAADLRAVLIVLCQTRLEMSDAEAVTKVSALNASEIAGCLSVYQVDRSTSHAGPLVSADSPSS